jgi:hypothetical protein
MLSKFHNQGNLKARLGVSHLRSSLIFTPIQKDTHAMSTFSPKACSMGLAFWQGLCIHLGLQNLKARVSFGLYGENKVIFKHNNKKYIVI